MDTVTLFEMAPRDGLQNEKVLIPTADKIALIELLAATGLRKIEVASFVNPTWVPQMADGSDVLAGITRAPGVSYTALTPNMKGFDRAVEARADEIAVFASASEGFSQANLNCSIAESLARFRPVTEAAQSAGLPIRGYVSCIVECPYDGTVSPEAVLRVTRALLEMGCYEVSLGDTIGRGTPASIGALLEVLRGDIASQTLAGHFHDTNGRASENIACALDFGLRTFDASVGGLGGCPFAPGSAGNVATETVVALLDREGFHTGVDKDALARAARFARALVDRDAA